VPWVGIARLPAAVIGSHFTVSLSRKPTHPGIQRVVGELSSSSAFFRRVWAENAVSIGGQQRGHLREAGAAEAVAETLAVQLAEDQTVLVFIPRSQSLSAVQFPPSTD
jgi:hypothetical protein